MNRAEWKVRRGRLVEVPGGVQPTVESFERQGFRTKIQWWENRCVMVWYWKKKRV